jgi:hypothetical protein
MKYNQASYKQSHNSYDRDEDSHQSLLFHPNDPGNAGCRGLEYDIWRHSDSSNGRSLGYCTVAHTALPLVVASRRPNATTSCS